MPPHVFIGAASGDYDLAQQIYDLLTKHGIEAFFSRESLPRLGSSDYRKQIDAALDQADHMVVVTGSVENVQSTWLEAEWGFFVNEKRSGHTKGNLVTIVAGGMTPRDLPPSLRYYEVIPVEQLERVLHYVGGSRRQVETSQPAPGTAGSKARTSGEEPEDKRQRRFRVADLRLPHEPMLGFVEVPTGPFLMGSDGKCGESPDEMPQHTVDLPAFYLARFPVTVAQFRVPIELKFGPRTADWIRGEPEHPVVGVSWQRALEYCSWLEHHILLAKDADSDTLNRLLGGSYHFGLPSEAEWEKAARGTDGRIYPWGDMFDSSFANYQPTGLERPSAVGAFFNDMSPYGIFGMGGNVREWTRSIYKPYPYVANDGRERPDGDDMRVLRGGSFAVAESSDLRAARRAKGKGIPTLGYMDTGFRIVSSRLLT